MPVSPVVVLMYHRLGDGGPGREPGEEIYTVKEEAFERQLECLRAGGHPVLSLEEATSASPSNGRRAVSLTFDDGSRSDHEYAAPALSRRSYRATFFVTPGWIGTPGFMDWAEVRELARLGMAVGAHGLDHTPLNTLPDAALRLHLRDARREIQARAGVSVATLSMPGGAGGRRELCAAREEGFQIIAGSVPRLLRRGDRSSIIPRFAVRRADSLRSFEELVSQNPRALLGAWGRYALLSALRRLLGESGYQRLRARVGRSHAT